MSILRRLGFLGSFGLVLSGCVSSHVMLGPARPPIPADQVKVYFDFPKTRFERIAMLDSSSRGSLAFTSQAKTDKVIERLKLEAAKLGANGIVLEGLADRPAGMVGTGVGQSSYSGGSAWGLGIGISGTVYQKVGHAIAIYVPSASDSG